ncbi:hypothetical protein HNQ54_002682 [Anaerocolumna cellulosilytica]|nr:hypothetical protein [Anaerocolumna cellulosilytica]
MQRYKEFLNLYQTLHVSNCLKQDYNLSEEKQRTL